MSRLPEVKALFDEVVDLSPSERESYLADSDADPAIVARVRQLLAVDIELGDSDEDAKTRRHPWPGDRVGSYRLIAPIGSGGMGTIWRAESLSAPEVTVAIKFPDWSRVEQEEAIGRLRQERMLLAALDHPGVVTLSDAGITEGGTPFLVLDELAGSAIDVHCRDQRKTAAELGQLIIKVAEAVGAVHDQGVVHRDVKPSNILVSRDGWPTLIDFGIARVLPESQLSALHVTQGVAPLTPAFASPEQERGESVTPAADVFAIGKVIGALLRHVTDRESAAARALGRVATEATRARSADRYADARALATELVAALASAAKPAASSRRGVLATAIVCTIVASVTVAIVLAIIETETEVPEDQALVPVALLEELRALPVTEMPGSADALEDLAVETDALDLLVAAAFKYVDDDQFAKARAILTAPDLLEAATQAIQRHEDNEDLELAVEDRLALAQLQSELGDVARSQATLNATPLRLLEPGDGIAHSYLIDLNRHRAGAEVDWDRFSDRVAPLLAALAAQIGEFDEDEESGLPEHLDEAIELLKLSAGDREAVLEWSDEEHEDGADPTEHSTEELTALLELHLRLVAHRIAAPGDSTLLNELEHELGLRQHEESGLQIARARILARCARVITIAGEDLARARVLAGDVRGSFVGASAPTDLLVDALAIEAWCIERLENRSGGNESSRAAWEHAAEEARRALGPDAPRTIWIQARGNAPTEAIPGLGRTIPDHLSTTIEQIQARPSPPLWWCVAPQSD